MTSGETMAETPGAKRGRRGPLLIVGGVAAGAIVAVVALVASGGKKGSDAGPGVSPVAATAPAAPAVPAAAPVAAPPREAPPPAQVLVRITSNPAGAMVTDAKRGVVIGATPFEQRFDRKATPIGVRLAKEGFSSIDLDVPLEADFDRTVQLERQKAKPSGKGASSSHAAPKKIAVAGGGGQKPAAAPASPPPAAAPTTPPPPAAPAKPKAEKW
jgi:DNA polymerase-3 subunit gamma/tau